MVVGRVVPDDVHDRCVGAARVVKVRQSVRHTGAQMEQRRGRLSGDPCVAVRGTGHGALEQSEYRTHLRNGIECGDKMHLGRSWIAEAHLDARVDQALDKRLCTVHFDHLFFMKSCECFLRFIVSNRTPGACSSIRTVIRTSVVAESLDSSYSVGSSAFVALAHIVDDARPVEC